MVITSYKTVIRLTAVKAICGSIFIIEAETVTIGMTRYVDSPRSSTVSEGKCWHVDREEMTGKHHLLQ